MMNWTTLGYGLTFGITDAIALPLVKWVHNGASAWWMLVPILIYAANPLIFLNAMKTETLTVMNLVWDMTSDLLITLIGLFVFRETLPPLKALGVFVSLIGLFLMTYEGNGWNEYLARNFRNVRESMGI
jgi:multidrug transporter EmrE-like cation transporter